MDSSATAVIAAMIEYLVQVIEKPYPAFGGMPICPFARKARLAEKIIYFVWAFSWEDLTPTSPVMEAIAAFKHDAHHELLLIIHPNPQAFHLEATHAFVAALNADIAQAGLIAFDGHPEDDFNIQGVYTRNAPFIHLTVQHQHSVKHASDLLLQTPYYDRWTPDQLRYVGIPRA